jgi:DNA polymerase-3 subunit delta'
MGIRSIENNTVAKRIILGALEKEKLSYSIILKGTISDTYFMAIQIAKALNCNSPELDSCDMCDSCIKIERNVHPDVIVEEPEGSFIKISQIRRLIEIAPLRPMIGKKRVFIIKEADSMNEEAANSFLKTLEEPSSYSHFLLLTKNPEKILPTIRSRCLQIEIFSEKDSFIEKFVKKGFPERNAYFFSTLFENDFEMALSYDMERILQRREIVFKIIKNIMDREYLNAMDSLLSEIKIGKNVIRAEWNEDIDIFLKIILTFMQDFIKLKVGNKNAIANSEFLEKMEELKERLELEALIRIIERIEFLRASLERNVNQSLFPYILFIELKEGLNVKGSN